MQCVIYSSLWWRWLWDDKQGQRHFNVAAAAALLELRLMVIYVRCGVLRPYTSPFAAILCIDSARSQLNVAQELQLALTVSFTLNVNLKFESIQVINKVDAMPYRCFLWPWTITSSNKRFRQLRRYFMYFALDNGKRVVNNYNAN